MTVDDSDKQIFEMITNVPRVTVPIAVVCGVVNLILPGLGTIIAACMHQENVSKAQIAVGIF